MKNQKAAQYNQTSRTVTTGYELDYRAGSYIELKEGFEVNEDAVFYAPILNYQ